MAIRQAEEQHKPILDIRGPQGNAFSILGAAQRLSKELGHSKEHTQEIQDKMTAGDYEELLQVFDRHYGEFIDIVR